MNKRRGCCEKSHTQKRWRLTVKTDGCGVVAPFVISPLSAWEVYLRVLFSEQVWWCNDRSSAHRSRVHACPLCVFEYTAAGLPSRCLRLRRIRDPLLHVVGRAGACRVSHQLLSMDSRLPPADTTTMMMIDYCSYQDEVLNRCKAPFDSQTIFKKQYLKKFDYLILFIHLNNWNHRLSKSSIFVKNDSLFYSFSFIVKYSNKCFQKLSVAYHFEITKRIRLYSNAPLLSWLNPHVGLRQYQRGNKQYIMFYSQYSINISCPIRTYTKMRRVALSVCVLQSIFVLMLSQCVSVLMSNDTAFLRQPQFKLINALSLNLSRGWSACTLTESRLVLC